MNFRKIPDGGSCKTEVWWWKDWANRAGRYAVGLIGVYATEWRDLGTLQTAVVDDFGNLVQVPA